MESQKSQGMVAVLAALVANVLVAVAKFAGFLLSGSAAMMNEAIHSVVDTANEALLLLGNRRA
ncbi:MAG: cation transporter, partial [Streptococcaceae bacterium]|nr:cation transporter [Streptococcaceae bacterium]